MGLEPPDASAHGAAVTARGQREGDITALRTILAGQNLSNRVVTRWKALHTLGPREARDRMTSGVQRYLRVLGRRHLARCPAPRKTKHIRRTRTSMPGSAALAVDLTHVTASIGWRPPGPAMAAAGRAGAWRRSSRHFRKTMGVPRGNDRSGRRDEHDREGETHGSASGPTRSDPVHHAAPHPAAVSRALRASPERTRIIVHADHLAYPFTISSAAPSKGERSTQAPTREDLLPRGRTQARQT
jgi:hypothetical protein